MDLVRELVRLGRGARESVKIKVRQPIQKVLVDGNYEALISDLVPLVQEELNVKEVEFAKSLNEYMNFTLKPNFRVLGPLLGKNMGLFGKALKGLDASVVAPKLDAGETVVIDLGNGDTFEATSEHILVAIDSKEGFTVGVENNVFIILDTTLNEALINEGYAREFVSRVQQQRKANDFEVTDNIKICYMSDEEFAAGLKAHEDFIKSETLTVELDEKAHDLAEEFTLNGHDVKIYIEKA